MNLHPVFRASMEYEITNQPGFAQLDMTLDAEEGIRAEAGSLVSHSQGVEITATEADETDSPSHALHESNRPFATTFTAKRPGTVTLAPPFPGDIFHFKLRDEILYAPSCSFLAVEFGVELDAELGENERFVECKNDFLLELSGSGSSFLSSYGALSVVSLDPEERYEVDTGHVVAFEETVDYSLRRVSSVSSVSGHGDGLLCEFEGPGTIWTQSRSPTALLAWVVRNNPGSGGNASKDE
ncbi:TIGR00266 family protein [Haladaptatus litoreus]|uniref:TIGR00266 family protein n=1 Tax=Haladaptatus litoreus TaxID=553468 RepID=A0A1N7BG59_9EURY|nr:TIGR00266 family protein [Haladaptatus litoreus]SIR50338.1 TIGR00266 family protein [Haladaptatus litoreus]